MKKYRSEKSLEEQPQCKRPWKSIKRVDQLIKKKSTVNAKKTTF